MKIMLAIMWLLHWLPLPLLGRIGEALGSLLFHAIPSRRHITLTNLRLCFPELPEAQRRQLAKRHFQAYARSVIERSVLWWGSEARLRKLIVFDPPMPVEQIREKPTILLCPHFVCLDVAGSALALNMSACSIYTPQRNKVFDEALRRGRSRFHPVKIVPRAEGIKPIIRAMREGMPFFMLPDMDFGPKDAEFVPFFGMPAATLTATARLAGMTGAQVIPVIAGYLPDYRGWKVSFMEPWQDYPGDDIVEATRRMNAFIEARVREMPEQYFWAHKRFKTRPSGEPGVY